VSDETGSLLLHLIVAPVLLPLTTAALLLLIGERRHRAKALIGVAATVGGLAVAVALMLWVRNHSGAAAIGIYLPSNWRAPFGIVLVVDGFTALMLALTGVVSVAAALFGLGRWHRAGVHYHTLFQLQLAGVNGAFLTGDLFNLFVFFEVMLAASYGLLLHGSGTLRVRAGLKYIAFNLLASTLFLVGVAIIYGVTGTLNYADIAQKLPQIPAADRGLLHAGAAILGVAVLAKAAMWPLNFWLASAYSAAAAPVAAVFVMLTKVGVYTILRLWTLLLAGEAGASVLFGGDVLIAGGLATLAFGAIGMLASQQLRRVAGYSLIISSGTSLAVIGVGDAKVIGAALFYLVGSTVASCALYLLAELVERSREIDAAPPIRAEESDRLPFQLEHRESLAEERDDEALAGEAIPAATAFLGLSFIGCALMIAGLPPLAGFIAKFAILGALLDPVAGSAALHPPAAAPMRIVLFVMLLASGLLSTIALSRAGLRHFWMPHDRAPPHLRIIECVPIAMLLVTCAMLAIRAEPVLRYARDAASGLADPARYIDAVMSAAPAPGPSSSGPVTMETVTR
jgi:multicomponent K+:H+ antiporter subunit D